MGYDRNDGRFGRDQNYGNRSYGGGRDYGRGEDGGYDRDRGYRGQDAQRGRSDYGRPPQGYDYEDRGFFDRAGDEVRSWFGDEEAERRRRFDERFAQRDYDRDQARYGRESYGRDSGGRYAGFGDPGFGTPVAGYGWSGDQSRDNRDAGGNRDSGRDHDPSYRSWRDRQIEALDRDYDDYRREHQSKFDNEFTGWRGKRQTQRDSLKQAREHQEVVGTDGVHVGTVDHVRDDRILLTKTDKDAGGHHHSIPSSWIEKVDEKVHINRTADQAKQAWKDEENNSAIGGQSNWSSDDRSGGPRNLNRSFSGTY
ncbi:DUF2171 domain-containing protein [Sphingomonas profundi]|uniref:DUF2171 domain-containing protein n=1 Tax=Alterirhizorhabdus profundi TaxID=2681549 RepID=UPI0012E7C3E1|nr:DUF2171 domain-containing protein [Sphingomonas profundi]